MGFPQTVIPVHVRFYLGANPSGDRGSWPAPTEVTSDVRVAQGISIAAGRSNEAAEVDASSCSFTIDNRAGKYTPTNPASPYFGTLRRNTPMGVATDIASDNFSRTTSPGWGTSTVSITGAGLPWSHGVAANYSTNGSVGVMSMPATNQYQYTLLTGAEAVNIAGAVTLTPPVVSVGGDMNAGILARYRDPNAMLRLRVQFLTTGNVGLQVFRIENGTQATLKQVTLGAYSAGQAWRLRWDVNGASILMKAWPIGSAEPATWQLSVADGKTPLGARNGVLGIRDGGNTTSTTVSFDDYTIESTDYSGYLTELPTRWDQSGKDSTAPVRAAGVLRRLLQGNTPVKSPIVRQLSGVDDPRVKPSAFWPLEDDASATSAANIVPYGNPMVATDVAFGNSTDLPAALQVARLNSATSRLQGTVRNRNGGTGFSAMGLFKLPAGVTNSTLMVVQAAGTFIAQYAILVTATTVQMNTYDPAGVLVYTGGVDAWSLDPTKWFAIQLEVDLVGGNHVPTLIWHQIGSTTYTADSAFPATATSGYIPTVTGCWIQSSTTLAGALVSSIWLGENTLPFVDNTFSLVTNAYIGENAGDRFSRLLREEGVTGVTETGAVALMGPQRADSLIPLLRDCAQAEFGVLNEFGFGLSLRVRANRYQRPIVLSADVGTLGQVAAPPEPTYDDQQLRNYWAVSRDGGAQDVTASDPVSILAEGKYDDSVTLNSYDDTDLINQAGWRVMLGTWPDMRWPLVQFDLARNPSMIAAWRQTSQVYGQRAQLTNTPTQVNGATVDLVVEGTSAVITPFGWDTSINASPGAPWNVGTLDDGERMDTAGCYLATSATSTAPTVFLATTLGPGWTTAAADLPFDIVIAGERMTVTAMGAAPAAYGDLGVIDGTMESGSAGWAATNGVVTNTAVLAHGGTKSSLLTVTGTPSVSAARSTPTLAVKPGQQFTLSMWARSPVALTVGLGADFYDAAGNALVSSVGTVALAANTWTLVAPGIYIAPATATGVRYGPNIVTPASGTLIYFDDVTITAYPSPLGAGTQTATVTRSVNGVVKAQTGGVDVTLFAPTYLAL